MRKMKYFLLLLFYSLLSITCYSQSKKEIRKEKVKSNERMLDTLQIKISGVKYADFGLSKAQEEIFINNSNSGDALILVGIRNYLKDLGLDVIITEAQRSEAVKLSKSQCDYVRVRYDIGEFKSKFGAIGNYPFSFNFEFCDNSVYSFNSNLSVNGLTNYSFLIKSTCAYYFPLKKKYDQAQKLKIEINPIVLSKSVFNNYLDTAISKKAIEGIYQLFSSDSYTSKYTIGIYFQNDTLKIVYFDGADFSEDWKEGELKGYLFSTLSENDYLVKWYSLDKVLIDGSVSFTSKNAFEFKSNTLGYDKGIDKFVRIK